MNTSSPIQAELIAVLAAVTEGQPRVMTLAGSALPSGPLETSHRSLQQGLRAWVADQTGGTPGFLEQLYTFADRDRANTRDSVRSISISYLGLMRENADSNGVKSQWSGWYRFLPWEDHRDGRPGMLDRIGEVLVHWARSDASPDVERERQRRIDNAFGKSGLLWNEEMVLQRYELLYEAGMIEEASSRSAETFGVSMLGDHRRILATAVARLRAKIKYRPVVFELMPDTFTLLQLQRTVEALAGRTLYKPNFRRLIEQHNLVEETGESESETGGRPAKVFRFRTSVLEEREFAGTKLPLSRG